MILVLATSRHNYLIVERVVPVLYKRLLNIFPNIPGKANVLEDYIEIIGDKPVILNRVDRHKDS